MENSLGTGKLAKVISKLGFYLAYPSALILFAGGFGVELLAWYNPTFNTDYWCRAIAITAVCMFFAGLYLYLAPTLKLEHYMMVLVLVMMFLCWIFIELIRVQ